MKWVSAKFKDVFFIHGGNPSPKEGEFDEEGIPFVKMKDLGAYHHTTDLSETENKVSIKTIKSKRLKIIPKGSLLIPRSGSVAQNHRALLSQDSVIVSHICALEVKDKTRLFNLFAYYYLTTIDMVKITKKTTGLDAITFEDLAELEIPLPPLATQQRIAEILDAADALRKKDQELLKKYDELAQAIFIDMFGDPVKNEKGWEIDVANNHMDVLSGYAFKSEQYSKDKNNISLCGGLIIMPWGIEWDKANRWSIESSKGLEKFFLKEDDIVMAMDRPWISTGFKIAMIKKEDVPSLLVQRTARIRAKDINQFFLYFLFKHSSFEKHVSLTETTVPHISPNDIRSFEIIVPPIKLQNQYAENIKGIEAQKQVIKMQINFSGALFNSCIQKAFSGELVS